MTSPYPITCSTRTVAGPLPGRSSVASWSSGAAAGISTASGRPYRRKIASTASGGIAATRAKVRGRLSSISDGTPELDDTPTSRAFDETALEGERDHLAAHLRHVDGQRILFVEQDPLAIDMTKMGPEMIAFTLQ